MGHVLDRVAGVMDVLNAKTGLTSSQNTVGVHGMTSLCVLMARSVLMTARNVMAELTVMTSRMNTVDVVGKMYHFPPRHLSFLLHFIGANMTFEF